MPTHLPAPPVRGLEPCLEFECFIADLTSALMSGAADILDGRIQEGLERIAEQTCGERSSLARFAEDGGSLTVTHSSGASAIPTSIGTDLCWYREQLGQGRCLRLSQLPDDLPARAAAEREVFRKMGMRSHVAVPLLSAGRIWGAIALGATLQNREWTDLDIRRLRLTGEIMMAAVLRHELEAAVRQQREELIHVARLAMLSELTVTLTHELNQPLTAIRANAQATQRLLARGARAENLDDVLFDIVADATRSADLIRRLDALLRRRHLEQSPVNVNQAVRDIQVIARMEAQCRGATLVLQLAPDLPDVTGDSVQLQQVLLNLVRNAAEAMATIEPDARQVVVATSLTAPDQVTVSVRDAGPPLDDAVFRRLFSQFYTTKPDGLGMGLAISRSIVEAHGGRLWGERRAGGGLVMQFTLPTATSPAENRTKVPRPASRSCGKLGHARRATTRSDLT